MKKRSLTMIVNGGKYETPTVMHFTFDEKDMTDCGYEDSTFEEYVSDTVTEMVNEHEQAGAVTLVMEQSEFLDMCRAHVQ